MSKAANRIKRYYDRGFWTLEMVRKMVGTTITAEEFEEITGKPYNKND